MALSIQVLILVVALLIIHFFTILTRPYTSPLVLITVNL